MGNIVGEGFAPEIVQQIKVRQTIYGSVDRNNEKLSYLEARTGWCKLVSSVDVQSRSFRNLPSLGSELSKDFILWNGVTSSPNAGRGGVWPGTGDFNDYAYGIGGTEFGLKPMPGIKSASIKTETRGSLKTATIQIQANNRAQFDIIDALYLRLGYTMLLEWGHSSYYKNNGAYEKDNPYSLVNSFLSKSGKSINELQNVITKTRLDSNGNYDAILGKVVNFNWTYTKEGTYDITLTLRSIGDVIESLKTNILLPGGALTTNVTSSEPPQNANELIEAFANTNEITKEFYNYQQKLKDVPPVANGMATWITDDIVIYFKQTYSPNENSPKGDEYYVRFGEFLNFLESKIIPNINNDSKDKLIYIDTDTNTNIIYLEARQISADPRICMFKTSFQSPSLKFTLIPSAENFVIKKGENYYGKIMNAYFNMSWILTTMEELKDDKGKVNLYDLIKALCDGWNRATGNFNSLEPVLDSETNTIKIIDENPLPDKDEFLKDNGLSTELAFFDVYGYNLGRGKNIDGYEKNQYHAGFIKDLSFNTTVPPNLATMITIGATSQGYIVGQDATALSRMNDGLVDRWITTINHNTPSGSATTSSLQEDYAGPLDAFNRYIGNLSSINNSTAPKWDGQIIETMVQNNTQFLEYDQAKQTQELALANSSSASPTNGFLPFDLSLTMDGLSGMKVYQQFTIDSDFLPLNYPRSLNFLIKGITHDISSNQWNTIIESIAVSKNPKGSVRSNKAETFGTRTSVGGGSAASTNDTTIPYISDPVPSFRATSLFAGKLTRIGGVPNQGTHNSSGWENFNAYDLHIDANTLLYAPAKLKVISSRNYGSALRQSGNLRIYGVGITLEDVNTGNRIYLAHLGSLNTKARPGAIIEKGEFLATIAPVTQVAPHVHFSVQNGNVFNTYLKNTDGTFANLSPFLQNRIFNNYSIKTADFR